MGGRAGIGSSPRCDAIPPLATLERFSFVHVPYLFASMLGKDALVHVELSVVGVVLTHLRRQLDVLLKKRFWMAVWCADAVLGHEPSRRPEKRASKSEPPCGGWKPA